VSDSRRADPLATLGPRLDGDGVEFAVATLVAEGVELCLLDPDGAETRVALEAGESGVWSGRVAGVGHAQRYGFRVHGPFEPARGARCDPSKLLVDPRALAIEMPQALDAAALSARGVDTSHTAPVGLVMDPGFDWGDDDAIRPRHAWEDTVIYELHVRGATMRRHEVPEALRGTYAGLAHPAMIDYLVELGVTSVELLPVHELLDESFLLDAGLTNYWGYNSLGFFAPAARYAAASRAGERGGQLREFKAMVRALHAAGIEVILDVVYNHTAESDERGPVVSMRGLDAASYYRHDDRGRLIDTTGCGNSINAHGTIALGLVVDSLRYWVQQCHVDGFRFDLAPTLARPEGRFDSGAPFLEMCLQDPVLRGSKLIAEPWDVGCDDSFALGRFPAPFREWNGRFRDAVRDFWRSEDGTLAELATRFAGSSDYFDTPGRTSSASVNFVTAHDGFTLQDLVTYEVKRNEANGQGNSDGTDDNRSWNCGVEGPSDDPDIVALRERQVRALLATVVLACGVPMLVAGDELGRTQGGNNNAYCQDNETSWIDWEHADAGRIGFTRRLLELRRRHPVLRRRRFVAGATGALGWFTPDGEPMADADWQDPGARCVAIHLGAHGAPEVAADDDDLVVLVNGWWEQIGFAMPDLGHTRYEVVLDTAEPDAPRAEFSAGGRLEVSPRSIVVLSPVGDQGR